MMMRMISLMAAVSLAFGAPTSTRHEIYPPSPRPVPALASLPRIFPTNCVPKGIDIVFALDSSASIGLARYDLGKQFLMRVIGSLPLGTGKGQTRVSLFQFAETQWQAFTFDQISDGKLMETFISQDMFFQNGTLSNIADAIGFARTTTGYFGDKARGPPYQKVLAFLTDGWTDETDTQLRTASKQAEAANINIFLLNYGDDMSNRTAADLVGEDHLDDRVLSVETLFDIAQLTGCEEQPVITTTPDDLFYCLNGGSPGCLCPPGYTGKHCENAINYCEDDNRLVNYKGDVKPYYFCHGHGNCTHDNETGSACDCDDGYYGDWCQMTNTTWKVIANRCIAYQSNYTKYNGTEGIIQDLCNTEVERCIPDNLDCAFNVPVTIVDGEPVCIPEAKYENHCRCEYPIGWCIPLEIGNNMIKSAAATRSLAIDYMTTISNL